jgi:hypothetical protein
VVAQHQRPGVEGAGHRAREQAGAGHQVEPQLPLQLRHRQPARRRPLAADHLLRAEPFAVQDDGAVAARTVQVRLHDLQGEPRRRRRVEGVAAALQHRHPHPAGDPMGGGDGAEGAGDLGTGGEHRALLSRPRWPPRR